MGREEIFIEKDLPGLLSHEEFIYYFKRYKEGDIRARQIILEHNIALVISRVRDKYNTAPYEKEELIAAGMIGLINALDKFDLAKKTHFSTFAYKSID